MLLLAGCPQEMDDSREVRFTIEVERTRENRRAVNPQTLTVGSADAAGHLPHR